MSVEDDPLFRQTGLTAAERKLRAKTAVNTQWAAVRDADRTAKTAAMRRNSPSQLAYWEDRLDPNGEMDPQERAKLARNLQAAHFSKMALKSAKARRLRKARQAAARKTPDLESTDDGGAT
jgi:hypothetical protein